MFKSTKVERLIARAVVALLLWGALRAGLGHVRRGCLP